MDMMSRHAIRAAVLSFRSILSARSLLVTPSVRIISDRVLATSPNLDGKNVYYGYAKKENQQQSGKGHSFYVVTLAGGLVVLLW